MNLLRNPWVTALLAIVAVVVVWRNLFPSHPDYPRPVSTAASVVTPAVSSRETVAALNLPAKTAVPESVIDRDYIQSHLAAWIALPERDPFQLLVAHNTQQNTDSAPWVRWKLKAIWRQDGSSLCAINSGIYTEGDMIDGYRIDKIEDGHVWLQGPKLRERLTIEKLEPDADVTVPIIPNPIIQPLPVKPEPAPTNNGHVE